jgi:hypothetical protein
VALAGPAAPVDHAAQLGKKRRSALHFTHHDQLIAMCVEVRGGVAQPDSIGW